MKVFGFAGYSGSGKTSLVERIIPRLTARGIRVSVIKHAHHSFEIDVPGKDSYRHRRAGASEILVSSSARWALIHELRGDPEARLNELLERLSPCDLVLIEGFKREPIPKLEVHRADANTPLLFPQDPTIVAIATDEDLASRLPRFGLEDFDAIAAFVVSHVGLD